MPYVICFRLRVWPGWTFFLVFRFIGVVNGAPAGARGCYQKSWRSPKWRGRLVGLFQINIVIGILLAYLSNAIIEQFHLGLIEWRVELGIAVLPALLFLLLLLSVPQSSRWLVTQNRIDEALLTLTAMGSPDSQAEVDAIIESLKTAASIPPLDSAAADFAFTLRFRPADWNQRDLVLPQ